MSEDAKTKLRSAARSTLPVASIIPDPDTFKQAVKLLKEATAIVTKQSEQDDRLKEIKSELAAICEAYEVKGFRHGLHGFEYHGYTTRKTLSKEKLLLLGVSADQIDKSYVDSAPFLSSKIVPFDIP